MLNEKFTALLVAVLFAVSATATPCRPCNNGPRPQLPGLPGLPGLGSASGLVPTDKVGSLSPLGVLEDHAADLVDVAEGKKDPLATLAEHIEEADDVAMGATGDAIEGAEGQLPQEARGVVPQEVSQNGLRGTGGVIGGVPLGPGPAATGNRGSTNPGAAAGGVTDRVPLAGGAAGNPGEVVGDAMSGITNSGDLTQDATATATDGTVDDATAVVNE